MSEVNLKSSHSPLDLQSTQFENNAVRADKQQKLDKPQDDEIALLSSKNNDKLIEDVKSNLDKLNTYIPVTSTNLSFEFDDKNEPPFIRVIDKENKEVIREIPSKEFREVAKALDELADKLSSKGLLFDSKA
jgi:flagellar protein FlaG